MYPTESDRLVCSRALAGDCWNRVRPHEPLLRQRVLDAILAEARKHPPFEGLLLAATKAELMRLQSQTGQRTALLEKQLQAANSQIAAVTNAVAESNGQLPSLLEKLKALEDQRARVLQEIAANEARAGEPPVLSDEAIRARMPELLRRIAAESFDFADWIRKLISELKILPVQALDTPLVRARVQFVVRWAALVKDAVDDTCHALDVGEVPQHIQDALVLQRSGQLDGSLAEMARTLGITKMRLKRAKSYLRLMQEAGVTEPYRLLTEPPESASRWRRFKAKRSADSSPELPAERSDPEAAVDKRRVEIAAVG